MVTLQDYYDIHTFLLKNNIHAILYGSLGASVYLGNFKKFDDIDLLIPDTYISDQWQKLITIMERNGFTLCDEKEHEFKNDQQIKVAFAGKNILSRDAICDPVKDIISYHKDGITIQTLPKEAFIKAYTFSSHDGYRKEKRGKNDLDIVDKLRNLPCSI